MNNADMPANSTSLEISDRYEQGYYDKVALGLTKREAFAMAAMQGLLANAHLADVLTSPSAAGVNCQSAIIRSAISSADELLKELDNEQV